MPANTSFTLTYPVFAESLSDGPHTLLQFLRLRYARMDEDELKLWINCDQIKLDDQPAKPGTVLKPEQKVSVILPGHREDPVSVDWQMIWQNDEIMAVYKPHLLPVSRTTRNLYNTLIQLVRRQTPHYDAHLLHRLDTETGGLILIAKNKAADLKWKKQLNRLIEHKMYRARVYGDPTWQETTLECELSEQHNSAIRSQMYVVDPQQRGLFSKPKQSKTHFKVLQHDRSSSLIECELFSGRKHQIRAHLAHLGYPIIGDKIYAYEGQYYLKRLDKGLNEADFTALGGEYHQLQASMLQIRPDPEQPPVVIDISDSYPLFE